MSTFRNKPVKILYIMHIDWNWIKQRPQFLAEKLTKKFSLVAVYPRVNNRKNLSKNPTNIRLKPILQLPFARYGLIQKINHLMRNVYCVLLSFIYKPDFVWITFPGLISPSVGKYMRAKLVYDCMDDAAEFESSSPKKAKILDSERQLLIRANTIFVSSSNLYHKLIARGASAEKITLVRNAYNGIEYTSPGARRSSGLFKILYIGTIADYIDFDIILHCLNNVEDVEFHFVGPIHTSCPEHDRLRFYGPVAHAQLGEFMEPFDCFIMPFKLNELIYGVDPVKLYEYVNFQKNILCIHYPEVDRFTDFVLFFRDHNDLVSLVKRLIQDNQLKYSENQRRAFLAESSWEDRAGTVSSALLLGSQK